MFVVKINPKHLIYYDYFCYFNVQKNVFPVYEKNDKGHGILHILEVVRRSFVLNNELNLELNPNMIYAIAASHDVGKYEEHETGEKHAKIAARRFANNKDFAQFFSEEDRKIIKEAIGLVPSLKLITPNHSITK